MIIMDYDNWLQKGAGCFDNYLEADDDEIFEYYRDKYYDFSAEEALNEGIMPSYIADSIIDRMWEDEEVLRELEAGNVDDLAEWEQKHPDKVETLYERTRPNNAAELRNLIGKDGWLMLKEEFYKFWDNQDDYE